MNRLIRISLLISFALLGSPVAHGETLCDYQWNRNLRSGDTGSDVLELQKFLNSNLETRLALEGVGSPGKETGWYGHLTAQAVSKFQEKHASSVLSPSGLTRGTGLVGPQTRAQLNKLCGPRTAILSDVLTVQKTDQPGPTLALAGAGGVPFTIVMLTAGDKDITVEKIVVERTGPGVDNIFESISLIDETDKELGDEKTLNSQHQVLFDEPFVVPARRSKTLTILGNITDDIIDYVGQTPILTIHSIEASSPIQGVLPIHGTGHVVNNTIQIGGATTALSPLDPGVNTSRYINEKGIRFSGIQITASPEEDLFLSSLTWDEAGTAGPDDIKNIATIIHNVRYPAERENNSYTSTFSPEILIAKGQTIDIHIEGDITTTGVGRTVKFDIRGSDDIGLTGGNYGYGVGTHASGHTATNGQSVFITSDGTPDGDEGTPFFSGSTVTITGATLLLSKN